ncbi:hypothetical protein AB3S75_042172 [Citrus x aurantiifolia]
MKSDGENVSTETIVSKVLRSLSKRFDHVVAAIEESKDLSNYSFDDELMCSLLAHEDMLNRSVVKTEEKAFPMKGESSYKGKSEDSRGRGRGRGGFHGRGHGGRGRGNAGDSRQHKRAIQC